DEPGKSAKAAAILVLVGFVNIPIIKFSVDWWNTLHQPASVMRMDGPAMPAAFLTPLLLSALGFTLLFFALHLTAMRNEILRRRVEALSRLAARRAETPSKEALA
ncbi:MAG: heme transporter HemC, partial [Fulvimarina manganoxydans]|nr:heme transporter HemC [Fulvimarina manganoxydans]